MKKIFIFVSLLLILTGCSLFKINESPSLKVEQYLQKYQQLDNDVTSDLDNLLSNSGYTVEQKARYKEIMKKHYKDLKYNIKSETIDGDKAIVETEITVYDYSNILSMNVEEDKYKDEQGNYSPTLFYDYQLDLFEKNIDKVTYNISFNLEKDGDNWKIIQLDEDSIKKIHGIYLD